MKIKTSVTLSEDLLRAVDRKAGPPRNRSAFIEAAVRAYISQLARNERNRRDLKILNAEADRLNREAEDVLSYQKTL